MVTTEENLLRERIQQIIHKENLSPRAFAIAIGKQPSNIYTILSGERGIPKGFTAAILTTFKNIRHEWLLFGEGPMYEGEEQQETPLDTRPRLPKAMSGGHLEDYYNGEKRSLCQEKPVITTFPEYDFSLVLKNNRMSPKYERGDELFFKKCMITEWGNDILLDTADGPKFKKVYDEGNCVKCVSYNKEEYPEFVVPKNLIYGYYRCVGVQRVF